MRHEKSMDLKGNTAGTSLYGVRHGKKSQTPQPELRQGAVHGNNSGVVHHDSGACVCDRAYGVGNMEGGARMLITKYSEVYPWNVEAEIEAGNNVYMLNKETGIVDCVAYVKYGEVVKATNKDPNSYYFWKKEVKEDTEEPQATTSGEDET